MNHQQVAQAFSDGATRGKGNNMFIDGDTIYSYGYHFPIAKHTGIYTDEGSEIILFTTRGYSNSTAKHISYTARALHGNYYVLRTENIEHPSLESMIKERDEEIAKGHRARLHKREHYQQAANIDRDITMLERYILPARQLQDNNIPL